MSANMIEHISSPIKSGIECFEALSSGTESGTVDDQSKASFTSSVEVDSGSPGERLPERAESVPVGIRSSPLRLKRPASKSPDWQQKPDAKTKRYNDTSSLPTPLESRDQCGHSCDESAYTGISDHYDNSCSPLLRETTKSLTKAPLLTYSEVFDAGTAHGERPNPCSSVQAAAHIDCVTTPVLQQNSFSYASSEAPDMEDFEFDTTKGKVTLWQFLLQLLLDPRYTELIRWTNNAGEFVLLRAEEVARLWGLRKDNNHRMNYDKLSRALRYYYQKNIIRKVHGHKFVYRFIGLHKLKGLPSVFPVNSQVNTASDIFNTFPSDNNKQHRTVTKRSPIRNRTSEFPHPPIVESSGFGSLALPAASQLSSYTSPTSFLSPSPSCKSSISDNISRRFTDCIPRYSSPATHLGCEPEFGSSSRRVATPLVPGFPQSPTTSNLAASFGWGFPLGDLSRNASTPTGSSNGSSYVPSGVDENAINVRSELEKLFTSMQQGPPAPPIPDFLKSEVLLKSNNNGQDERLNAMATMAYREVLNIFLQKYSNSSHTMGLPEGMRLKQSPPFTTPSPFSDFQNNASATCVRPSTPFCHCSCHTSSSGQPSKGGWPAAPPLPFVPAVSKSNQDYHTPTEQFTNRKTHSSPAPPTDKTKAWNDLMASWAEQWRSLATTTTVPPPLTSSGLLEPPNSAISVDTDHPSNLHYQRHIINMNRLREQLNMLAPDDRKPTYSQNCALESTRSLTLSNDERASTPGSRKVSSQHRLSPRNPLGFEAMASGTTPVVVGSQNQCSQKQILHRSDSNFVWMPIQVNLISNLMMMLSESMQQQQLQQPTQNNRSNRNSESKGECERESQRHGSMTSEANSFTLPSF